MERPAAGAGRSRVEVTHSGPAHRHRISADHGCVGDHSGAGLHASRLGERKALEELQVRCVGEEQDVLRFLRFAQQAERAIAASRVDHAGTGRRG